MDLKTRIGLLRSRARYGGQPVVNYRLRRFYRQFVSEGDLCFDLGAHIGRHSAAFLALGARVIAIEPQPACVRCLRRRFRRQGDRAVVVAAAVGEAPGVATLHINRLQPTMSTLAGEEWRQAMAEAARLPHGWDRRLMVNVITLEQLIQDFGEPAFVKIDVEGYEEEVLRGLARPVAALSFEFVSFAPTRVRAVTNWLNQLDDYVYNWTEDDETRLASAEWLSDTDLLAAIPFHRPEPFSGDIYARRLNH
jgi:FkbM family methyltransferase